VVQVEVEEVGGVVGVWWSTEWLGSCLKRQDELKKRHSLSVLMSLCQKVKVCRGEVQEVW